MNKYTTPTLDTKILWQLSSRLRYCSTVSIFTVLTQFIEKLNVSNLWVLRWHCKRNPCYCDEYNHTGSGLLWKTSVTKYSSPLHQEMQPETLLHKAKHQFCAEIEAKFSEPVLMSDEPKNSGSMFCGQTTVNSYSRILWNGPFIFITITYK